VDGEDGVAEVVRAAEHALEFEVFDEPGQRRDFGVDVGGEVLARLFHHQGECLHVVGAAAELFPLVEHRAQRGDLLFDLLGLGGVVPEGGVEAALVQRGQLLRFAFDVKGTSRACSPAPAVC
jgi:hypothetical protein